MTSKALLIVDVQNDFCPGGSLAVPDGDAVVKPINAMIEYARMNGWLIVASRDWHPAVTRHFKDYGGIWPAHCVQNTPGAEFHPDLRLEGAMLISKATLSYEDGYSPFEGHTGFGDPLASYISLEHYFHRNDVEDVYVCGLATDYCVKAGALDAAKRGFKTCLLLDACRAVNVNPGDGDKAVEEMRNAGVVISETVEVINGRA